MLKNHTHPKAHHSVTHISLTGTPENTISTVHFTFNVGKTTSQDPAPNCVTLRPYMHYMMVATLPIIKAVKSIKNLNVLIIQLDEILSYLLFQSKIIFLSPLLMPPSPIYPMLMSLPLVEIVVQYPSNIETFLISFISEFTNIIKPFLSLFTSILNKTQL